MIDQIISAMKISLADCKKYNDPFDYIFNLNQVLNRYKSNLFNSIVKAGDFGYDPKEFIHFRIGANWSSKPSWTGEPVLTNKSPVLPYVNGFEPEKKGRQNHEGRFSRTVDISDVVSLDRIAAMRTDYHTRPAISTDKNYISEMDELAQKNPGREDDISIYFVAEAAANDNYTFIIQINSIVYNKCIMDERERSAAAMHSDPKLSLDTIKRKSKEKTAVDILLPASGTHLTVTKPTPDKVSNFFNS